MHKKVIVHLLAVFIMIAWSLSYLSIKVVVSEVEPTLSAFYRFFIAAVILVIIHKIKYPHEKILKEDKPKIILSGLFGIGLYFFFENYSVKFTSAGNVAILIATIPIFTLPVQKIVFKEKMTSSKILGALLSVIGIIIIVASKERVSLFSKGSIGDLMALGAVLSWVIYNVVLSKFKGEYKSITVTTYQAIWGTIFLSPSLIIGAVNNTVKIPSLKVILNILFLAILCSCVCYVIYIYCLKNLGATVLTTYINLQPIMSLIAAAIILNEVVTKWQVIGCGVIILGVSLVSLGDKFKIEKFK